MNMRLFHDVRVNSEVSQNNIYEFGASTIDMELGRISG